MTDEQLEEMFEYIKAIPKIPEDVRGKEFKSKCHCGGTLTAWRVESNGHMRVKCDKCDFKLIA